MPGRVKLLVALGGLVLAVAVSGFLFGAVPRLGFGDRIRTDLDGIRADPICGDRSNVTQATFYSEMRRVDARMHAGMEMARSGNVDRDFAGMMIAHHQGAIEMALAQLKYGGDEQLRRLAQSIIIEQGQEIAYMRGHLGNEQTAPTNHLADR